MRRSVHSLGAASFAVMLMSGCGTTIRPHVSTGGLDGQRMFPPGQRLGPQRGPESVAEPDVGTTVDKICRSRGMRSGWIATRYAEDTGNCPESTDPENPYTVAVIERYSHRPVGSTMAVCADQPVPREWVREHNRDERISCPGARVRDGAPTAIMIRRVSGGSQ